MPQPSLPSVPGIFLPASPYPLHISANSAPSGWLSGSVHHNQSSCSRTPPPPLLTAPPPAARRAHAHTAPLDTPALSGSTPQWIGALPLPPSPDPVSAAPARARCSPTVPANGPPSA